MLAEKYFADDPNTGLLKLLQLAGLVPQVPNDDLVSELLERALLLQNRL